MAGRTPDAVEQQTGVAGLAALDAYLARSDLTRAEAGRVLRQVERLLPGSSTLPHVEFRRMGAPNAFALPGNLIVVTDELVAIATDDELAAMLAHELGHLQHRHGLQSVLRHSFALLLVTAATRDLTTLTHFGATVPFLILNNGYSRSFEREADEFALELLIRQGIDPAAFSSILQKIEQQNPNPRAAAYLSTHPSTEERQARFGMPATISSTPTETPTLLPNDGFVPAAGYRGTNLELPTAESSDVQAADVLPRAVRQVKPIYPFHLAAKKITGKVTVAFVVDRHGMVREAHVVRSTHMDFEDAGVEAVAQWQFEPGLKDGRPVNVRMAVPIVFNITEEFPTPPSASEPVSSPACPPNTAAERWGPAGTAKLNVSSL